LFNGPSAITAQGIHCLPTVQAFSVTHIHNEIPYTGDGEDNKVKVKGKVVPMLN